LHVVEIPTTSVLKRARPGIRFRNRMRNRWGQGERLRAEALEAAARLLGELPDIEVAA
jgi:hypothetical protein